MLGHNDWNRGQVGIGTLIVFIAMVLVAAIAAGVLVNTAGYLQASAESAGSQSADQLTNRLQVETTVGDPVDTTAVPREIATVKMVVKQAPGSDNVDLRTVTAQWVDDQATFDIVHADAYVDGQGDAEFAVNSVRDDDNSVEDSAVLNDQTDRAMLTFDLGSGSGQLDTTLSAGTSATVKLNTQGGGVTTHRLVVPETLSAKSAVAL
jgi:flagellin-like protein